jgi:hypothetical protein
MWSDFQKTDGGAWDYRHVRDTMRYVRWAHSRGLDPIIVLNYDRSGWNWNKYVNNEPAFFTGWNQFCNFVGKQYAPWAYYYQLSNEENNDGALTWDINSVAHADDNQLYRECANGLFSAVGSTDALHSRYLKTIVNPLVDSNDGCSWTCVLNDIGNDAATKPKVDIFSIDHYPRTWSEYGSGCHMDDLNTLQSISLTFGKRPAISETGYSSYGVGATEADMEAHVGCVMPAIRGFVTNHNSANPRYKYEFGSWYEFIDDDTGGGGHPEKHFGLLHTDLSPKTAYTRYKSEVSAYGI